MRLVTKMLADINTKLAAHDAKLTVLASHLFMPSDEESDMEETSSQPRKRPTNKLCTADNTVVNEVTWPHEVIFILEGKPALYDELSSMSFCAVIFDCHGHTTT